MGQPAQGLQVCPFSELELELDHDLYRRPMHLMKVGCGDDSGSENVKNGDSSRYESNDRVTPPSESAASGSTSPSPSSSSALLLHQRGRHCCIRRALMAAVMTLGTVRSSNSIRMSRNMKILQGDHTACSKSPVSLI